MSSSKRRNHSMRTRICCLLSLVVIILPRRGVDALSDHSRLEGVPQTTPSRACSLFVWDAPSALLRVWSDHLLRNCIIEGKGGKKFLRVPAGSLAALLYPCRKFPKNRCLLCGGNFHNHLRLWWFKYLYLPWDRATDISKEEADDKGGYHHAYVVDLDHVYQGTKTTQQREKALKRALRQHPAHAKQYQIFTQGTVRYLVPEMTDPSNPILLLARDLLLRTALANLIELEKPREYLHQ